METTDEKQKFVNVIIKEGKCGFFGVYDFLVNKDKYNSYKVTIRTVVKSPMSSGTEEFDKVVISNAGGKLNLGCAIGGSIPASAEYFRRIVGEIKL